MLFIHFFIIWGAKFTKVEVERRKGSLKHINQIVECIRLWQCICFYLFFLFFPLSVEEVKTRAASLRTQYSRLVKPRVGVGTNPWHVDKGCSSESWISLKSILFSLHVRPLKGMQSTNVGVFFRIHNKHIANIAIFITVTFISCFLPWIFNTSLCTCNGEVKFRYVWAIQSIKYKCTLLN